MKMIATLLMTMSLTVNSQANEIIQEPKTGGKTIPVELLIRTHDKPANTIIITHGSGCVLPSEKKWADRVFSWGFNSVIIDHCSVRGIKRHPAKELPKNLQVEHRIQDYIDVANWIKSQSWHADKTAIIGFSRGGEGVLGFVNESYYSGKFNLPENYSQAIDVAIAYYPGCQNNNGVIEPAIPTLIHHGTSDTLAAAYFCSHYNLYKRNVNIDNLLIKEYSGAFHGFDIDAPDLWVQGPRGQVLLRSYNKNSAEESFNVTRQFVQEKFTDK